MQRYSVSPREGGGAQGARRLSESGSANLDGLAPFVDQAAVAVVVEPMKAETQLSSDE